jgi:hypothetical protein
MSKTRDTGFLGNVVKYDANGNVTVVNGATTLLSVSSSGQLTVPGDEVITGSLTVLGGITGAITGSATSASYAANASLLNGSGSGEFVPTGSFNTFSSSILTYTGSVDSRLGSLEITSGSNITRLSSIESTTGSLNTASGSAITRLNALEVTSGSNITRLSALETASGSAITRLSSLESRTGSYATTGSNTFDGGQYLSSSFNPTGFSTTASLYTDGGLRVTRDAYISGTLYLNNVTVFGTQSVAYISSSQLNIGTNLITVNTDTPSIRFGGLAVYDSGSTGLTGSLLWDSQNNHWVYSNPSGSSYSGGMFISGPRTSTLGSETGTTSCMLMAGQGGDHITSSMIYHSSTVTCIPNTLISTGQICAPTVIASTCLAVRSGNATSVVNHIAGASNNNHFAMQRNDVQYASIGLNGSDNFTVFGTSTSCPRLTIDGSGVSCFANSVQSTDFRYTNTGYLTYDTANTGTECLVIRKNGTSVLTFNSNSSATFACQVCVPRLQVFNTNSIVVIEGTATNGEGTLTIAGKNSSGTSRSAIFKYDNADIIRVATADAIPMRFETSDVTRMTILSTGISCFSCQVCANAGLISNTLSIACNSGDDRAMYMSLNCSANYNSGAANTIARSVNSLKFLWYNNCWEIGATRGDDTAIQALVFARQGNTYLAMTCHGIANFACQVCSPSFNSTSTSYLNGLVVSCNVNSNCFTGITVYNGAGGGSEASRAGIAFQAYDWVQSAIWHGRNTAAAFAGALLFGTNPSTSNLGVGGVCTRLTIDNNGVSTFACTVCAPTFKGGSFLTSTCTFSATSAGTNYDITGPGSGRWLASVNTNAVYHWNGVLALTFFDSADFGVNILTCGSYATAASVSIVNSGSSLRFCFSQNVGSVTVNYLNL